MDCSTPDFPVHHQLPEILKIMSTESVMPCNHLILCHPLLLPLSIFPRISVFSNESALCIRWPEYWSFSFNINPYNEHSWLISFRMDWLYVLAVQGTLKNLLQYHSSKASILQHSAFCSHFLTVINNDAVNTLFINFGESQLISSAYILNVITCKECEHFSNPWHSLHNCFLERLLTHIFPAAACECLPAPPAEPYEHIPGGSN